MIGFKTFSLTAVLSHPQLSAIVQYPYISKGITKGTHWNFLFCKLEIAIFFQELVKIGILIYLFSLEVPSRWLIGFIRVR